jgi:glucose-1-phosphate adenylyltransferase
MGSDYYQNLEEMTRNANQNLINIGIGERCVISNTIVDKNCRIGNDVKLNGGEHLSDINTPLYTIRDGIIVVKKGAVLPDGFEV